MARLIRKKGNTFEEKNVPVKLQDGTRGTLDVVYNKLASERIDELYDMEDLRNSEIYDEVVHDVDGIADEPEEGGVPVFIDRSKQKEEGAKDLAVVNHLVAHFFKLMRPAESASRTSRRQLKRGR